LIVTPIGVITSRLWDGMVGDELIPPESQKRLLPNGRSLCFYKEIELIVTPIGVITSRLNNRIRFVPVFPEWFVPPIPVQIMPLLGRAQF
jgi:hypothetical protein